MAKSNKRQRNNVVSVRFSDDELATLHAYAQRHGETPSTALRRAALYVALLTDPDAVTQDGATTYTWPPWTILANTSSGGPVTWLDKSA